MYLMFKEAEFFNQPIGSWSVGTVTDMRNMGAPGSRRPRNFSILDLLARVVEVDGGRHAVAQRRAPH